MNEAIRDMQERAVRNEVRREGCMNSMVKLVAGSWNAGRSGTCFFVPDLAFVRSASSRPRSYVKATYIVRGKMTVQKQDGEPEPGF